MVVPNSKVKGKGKGHPEEATEARGGVDYSYTLPSTSALEGVGIQRHAPAALPPGETRYTLYGRMGRPQGRLEGWGKSRPQRPISTGTTQNVAPQHWPHNLNALQPRLLRQLIQMHTILRFSTSNITGNILFCLSLSLSLFRRMEQVASNTKEDDNMI